MSMVQEDFEIIEKNIDGSLKDEALKQFEKRIAENPELVKIIAKERLFRDTIEEQSLRNKLNDFHTAFEENQQTTNVSSSQKVISFKPYLRYAAAACIAILLGWGGFTYLNNSDLSNQDPNKELFATYFIPDPGLPTTMSASDNFDFFEAMVSYKQGEYTKAITKWETLLKEKPKNDTLNYFIGVAHLANHNEGEAITFLQWASEYPESKFSKEIYHYLGLANIKKGNITKGKQNLELSGLPESEEILKVIK